MFSPLVELYRSGDSRGAVAAFMGVVGGPDWRTEVDRTVPGGVEQAEKDAATFFEVEVPALEAWSFDEDKASRISQPVLFVLGSESGPLFERPRELYHLLQMRDPRLVAHAIAEFLARHPL
jgi:hypothetical protein